jgi:hypothetical protein
MGVTVDVRQVYKYPFEQVVASFLRKVRPPRPPRPGVSSHCPPPRPRSCRCPLPSARVDTRPPARPAPHSARDARGSSEPLPGMGRGAVPGTTSSPRPARGTGVGLSLAGVAALAGLTCPSV